MSTFARPGEEMGAIGQAIEGDARDASSIATSLANQATENEAKAATTAHQGYVNNLLYKDTGSNPNGPDGGLYSMKGQDFVNAAQKVTAAIRAQRDQMAQYGGAGPNGQIQPMSGRAQAAFINQTDPEINAVNAKIGASTIVQAADAATQVSQARIQMAGATAVNQPNDTSAIDGSIRQVVGETADQMRRDGVDATTDAGKTVLAAKAQAAVSANVLRPVIEKALADNSTAGQSNLANLWNQYSSRLTPADNAILSDRVAPKLLEYHATQRVQQLMGPPAPSTGDGAAPYDGGDYYDRVHPGEGDGQSKLSSAHGPLQVTADTEAAFRAAGHTEDVNTEAGARAFSAWNGQRNAATIQAATGKPATNDQVTMAHLLGGGGAAAILANPNDPISKHLSPNAISGNGGPNGPLPGGPNMTGAEAAQTIPAYYARAAGKSPGAFAGPGAPVGTDVSTSSGVVPAPVRPPFEDMLAKEEASGDDPALKTLVMSKIQSNLHQYDVGTQTDRVASEKTMGDTLNALENGATEMAIPRTAYARNHTPAEVAANEVKIADSTAFGTLSNSLKFAPETAVAKAIADQQTIVNGAKPGANGEAPAAPLSAEDFATAQKHLNMITAVAQKNAEALKADPSAYVRANPTIAAAFDTAAQSKNPDDLARAIHASEAFQTTLGATPQAISTPRIEYEVAQIHQAKPEAVPGILSSLRTQYAAAWPDVFRDLVGPKGKLNPEYATLATMPQSGAAPVDYSAALQAKYGEKGKDWDAILAANPGAKTAMETAIVTNLQPLRDSYQGTSGAGVVAGYENSVRTLATYYLKQGGDPTSAVKKATDAIFANASFAPGIRAPTTLADGSPFSAQKVIDAGNAKTADLTDADLAPGVTAVQARAGRWVTNPDGKSVSLQVQNTDNTWKIVNTSSNNPVTMRYDNLYRSAGPPVATPLDFGMSGLLQ
jgi:hypothetical protein